MPHMPLRGRPLYLFLLYILFCLHTFRFSSQTCCFRVPCSETCHLYLNVTRASLRGSFQQSLYPLCNPVPLTAQNHFAPSIPNIPPFSLSPSSSIYNLSLLSQKFPQIPMPTWCPL